MRKKSIFKVLGTALVLSMAVLLNPVQADATSIGGMTIPDIPEITGGNTGQDSGSSSGTSTALTGTITSAPKNLKQTDSGTNSITFSWTAAQKSSDTLRGVYYYEQISTDSNFTTSVVNSHGPNSLTDYNNTSYSFVNLDAGKTYYVRVGASLNYNENAIPEDITTDGHWSEVLAVVTAPQNTNMTVKQTAATTTSVKLSWNGVSGADGYRIAYWKYLGETDSDAKTVVVSSTNTEIKNLSKNTKYSFRVYALRTSGSYTAEGSYGQILGVGVLPTKVSGLKVVEYNQNASRHKLKYEVDTRESASVYQYEIYRYDGKKKIVSGTTSSTSPTINKNALGNTKNTFLYIRVRAGIKLSNGKNSWGSWSNKYYFTRLDGSSVKLKKSGNGMKVSWKQEKGATGYIIYVGRSSGYNAKVTYHKVATISNGKTTSKKLSASLMKKKKVPFTSNKYYFVRVVAIKKVSNATYKSVVENNTYSAYAWYTKDKKWRMYRAV